jgi:hypothetical protein
MKYNSIFHKMLVAFLVVALFTGVSAAGEQKVTICHFPDTLNQTKEVPQSAVAGHLGHGDYVGACGQTPVAPAPELSTIILMSTGIIGLVGFSRLNKN